MHFHSFFPYLYVFLWLIYYMQGIFLPVGSSISQVALISILLSSIFAWIYTNCHRNQSPLFKGLNLLVLLVTIYGIMRFGSKPIYLYDDVIPPFNYLKVHYLSLLPMFIFYVFTKKQWMDVKSLRWLFFLFCGLAAFVYIRMEIEAIAHGGDDATNNSAYCFVQLFPILFLLKLKDVTRYSLALLLFLIIVLTMKRGAIIISGLCFVYFMVEMIKKSSHKQKVNYLIYSLIILIIAFFLLSYLYNTNDYLRYRVEQTLEGHLSQRDIIWEDLTGHLTHDATFMQLLFGTGADSTLMYSYNYAHNDWLELSICTGALGVFAYLLFWLYFIKNIGKIKEKTLKISLSMCFIIMFLKTFFSMSINDIFLPISCVIGYVLGMNQKMIKNNPYVKI